MLLMTYVDHLKAHGYKYQFNEYHLPCAIIDTINNRIIYIALHRKIVHGYNGLIIEIDLERLEQDIQNYIQKLQDLRKAQPDS